MQNTKYAKLQAEAEEYYRMMYPGLDPGGINTPLPGLTLEEVTMADSYTEVAPNDVSLKTKIGPLELNFGALTAIMDTVCGPDLAKVVFEVGGCGVLDRTASVETQLSWLREVLDHKPCLLSKPHSLPPDATLSQAEDINKRFGVSTIPILDNGQLAGILFTDPIIWDDHRHESVSAWMKRRKELAVIDLTVEFEKINHIMRNKRKKDAVLPVTDKEGRFHGMYFAKDFRNLNPSYYNGKPVIGVAIGDREQELEFAEAAMKMGASLVVVDSSHGDCRAVLDQTKRLIKINEQYGIAIVVGNYVGLRGYLDFADLGGIHGVKLGIGSGAICTTTSGTGVGAPIFTALQESAFVRRHRLSQGKQAPSIIVDGSVDVPGRMVVCFAGGADAFMAGKYFVAAQESLSSVKGNKIMYDDGPYVLYRGMASADAIKDRRALRYSLGKSAPEGKSGYVKMRGPLKEWIGNTIELVQSGFAHVGAANMEELQAHGTGRYAFRFFTPTGLNQVATRLRDAE